MLLIFNGLQPLGHDVPHPFVNFHVLRDHALPLSQQSLFSRGHLDIFSVGLVLQSLQKRNHVGYQTILLAHSPPLLCRLHLGKVSLQEDWLVVESNPISVALDRLLVLIIRLIKCVLIGIGKVLEELHVLLLAYAAVSTGKH